MSRRVVMLMLRRMGAQLRIHHTAEQHQPRCEKSGGQPWNQPCHRPLSKGNGLDRFLLVNLCHHVINQLFGQESAFDIFLDQTFFIDEHTDG